jgi:hypothetical protein
MNKTLLISVLAAILFGMVSCSKDDDAKIEEGDKIEKEDIIGKWTAVSGKYNLSLEITASGYNFLLSEPGNGGVTDKGTYTISGDGKISFENKNALLALGYKQNGKLSLTFVNSVMISMLGTAAAGNTIFTLSNEDNEEDDENYGFLVIQNLSEGNNIVAFYLYDNTGELIGSDPDILESGYQITYEGVMTGNYIVKVTDDKGKSFTSKSFKIIKDKATVLEYNGSALNVSATGIDIKKSGLSDAAVILQSN